MYEQNELTDHVDFQEITSNNYAKIVKSTTKNGYKEGIYDGRESCFQAGFDIGYEQGFKNAFTIGRYQGITAAFKNDPSATSESMKEILQKTDQDLLLKKPTRGQCQVCLQKDLSNEPMETITSTQSRHAENVSKALKSKYQQLEDLIKN